MKEARCKNCGQLVDPERNAYCPACHQSLDRNIVYSASSRGRAERKKVREIKNLLVRYAVGLIFLFIFVYVIFPKVTDNMKNSVSKSQDTSKEAPTTTIKQEKDEEPSIAKKTEVSKEIKPEQIYFIRVKDLGFGQETLSKFGKHDVADILTFTLKEYLNGDVWINEKDMVFIPFEKVIVDNKECWLLFPEKHVNIGSKNFPRAYDETSSMVNTYKSLYDSNKKNIYTYFMDNVISGNEMEAVYLSEWNEDNLTLVSIKFHYSFEEYKRIQTADGIVYELSDGSRVVDYMMIPHSIVVDQEASGKITSMYSEIVLDE